MVHEQPFTSPFDKYNQIEEMLPIRTMNSL